MTVHSVAAAGRRRSGGGVLRVSAAELPSRRVFQRTGGTAVVPLSGTYSGTASNVAARVISAATSAEVVGWTTVATSTTGTSTAKPVAWWMFEEASGNRASSAGSLDVLVPSASAPTKVAGPGTLSAVNFVKASTQQFSLAETGMSAAFPGRTAIPNNSMTVGAWVRVDTETGTDGGILSKDTNFQLSIEGNAVQFRIHSSTDVVVFSYDSQPYVAGTWKHYVGRYTQSTGEVALFVNGVKQTTATVATRKVSTGSFLLGASPFKPNFDGALAEVFICDTALTDGQIASVHTSGLSGSGLLSSVDLGTWTGSLTVPQGGWYKAQYRLTTEPTAVHTASNIFGVGDIWMLAGSSQQARMSSLINAAPVPDDLTVYFTGGAAWDPPGVVAGTGGNGGIRFLNLMRAATNVPQACVQVSVEGTAITDWEAGDAAYLTASNRLTQLGGVAGILWQGGGTGIGTVTRADYKTRLAALRTGLQSAGTVQRFAVHPLMHRTNAADTDAATQEARRADFEYISENTGVVNLGWVPDVPLSDDTNQTAAGSELMAYTYAHSLLYAMGVEPVSNLGPAITAASRSGTAVSLSVQHRSGTALKINSGGTATGFQVFPRGTVHSDAASLPVSSISLGAASITLTLASDPATALDVYYQYGRFDASSPVFDNTQALGRTVGNALLPLMEAVATPVEAGSIVNPALKLDNATGHIRYQTTTAWDLPDADWTIGVWVRIDNPAGTASQYIISTGAYGGTNTVNVLVYEQTSANPGRFEISIRGAGTALTISGPATPAFLDSNWRLFILDRAKTGEVLNVYHAVPGANVSLYHTASVSGLGAVAPPAFNAALGVRAPPLAGSERWLDGAVYSVFRMSGRLTTAEMNRLSRGDDLVSDLGKTPELYTKLNTLTSPIANTGSAANGGASVVGGVVLTNGPQFVVPSNAVQFDETALKYTMPKTASHTLPAGDWTLGFMMALDDNAGTVAQYIYSTGAFFGAGVINIFIGESGYAPAANMMSISLDDGAAAQDDEFFTPSLAARIDGAWYLWTVEHDSAANVLRVYYTPVNGVRVLFHTASLPNPLTVITPPNATVTIGTRQDTPDTRYFGGKMHLAFQMDGRLTQFQMQDIARGRDMKTDLSLSPKWYHKFSSTATTLTDLSGNGNTATASGGTPVLVSGPTFTPNG